MIAPPAIAHVGITVTDLDRAVGWYCRVLGFEPIGGAAEIDVSDGHAGAMAADVFGPSLQGFRLAHLASANGTALELFEFVAPRGEPRPDDFEYWRAGPFHVCVVAPDIEGTVGRIAASGGRRRSRIWQMFSGEPYRCCYCEDPLGNIVELYSHSHERTYANRAA